MHASVLLGAGREGDLFEVLWEDAERAFCKLSRNDAQGHRHAFLPIVAGGEHPTLESINRLAHEYELRNYLDCAWALRPLEFARERGQAMLIVEYTRGEPLDRLIHEPMEIGGFLRLAVSLTAALGQLHGRGLIHRDIKPANVLADLAIGQVWLTGFGITSRLSRKRGALESPEIISGTLAYMAPEQTGRMNRSVDTRSDLYSLA
jgi:serine/threonine protein kinase